MKQITLYVLTGAPGKPAGPGGPDSPRSPYNKVDRKTFTNRGKIYINSLKDVHLNMDFKILTKILANRLLSVLCHLISPDQTWFMPDKAADNNLRWVYTH